jgi:PhnB protein
MAVKPIPDGYHSITPYLVVEDAAKLIDFLKHAFEAQETLRMPMPDGSIGHAELKIGDSILMTADANREFAPTPGNIMLYVKDADTVYRRALQAGAASQAEPTNQFYGDRSARVRDPFGNQWTIATHIEDLSPAEIARRFEAISKQQRPA